MPSIFVGRDFILDETFDAIAEGLRRKGWRIFRGSLDERTKSCQITPVEYGQLKDVDVILVSSRTTVSDGMLDCTTRLRGVLFPSIGTNSISLESAKERGLIIGHGATPENFESMAESTVMLFLALMLDLSGKQNQFKNQLPRPKPSELKARMLQGKVVGYVGLGRIARSTTLRLQNWGVRQIAYDPFIPEGQVPDGVAMSSLSDLLAESDIVSLHVALTEDTRHLIGMHEIDSMKRSAFLVNTARGGLIDEDALLLALKEQRIAGAAIDTFEKEPLPPDSPFRELDNLIATQHIVGHTQELFASLIPVGIENAERLAQGVLPLYVRNADVIDEWQRRWAGNTAD